MNKKVLKIIGYIVWGISRAVIIALALSLAFVFGARAGYNWGLEKRLKQYEFLYWDGYSKGYEAGRREQWK